MLASQVDPWVRTIQLLSMGSRYSDIADGVMPATRRGTLHDGGVTPRPSYPPQLKVSLIERTTASTVTIAWRDATSCFYGAQVWRLARARTSGICVLSGKRIRRGDRIFHPHRSKPAPVNARAMILEWVLNEIEPLRTGQL